MHTHTHTGWKREREKVIEGYLSLKLLCSGVEGEIIFESKGNSNKDDENNGHLIMV